MEYLRYFLIFFLVVYAPALCFGQEKFDESKLEFPNKYGEEISMQLQTIEVYEYEKDNLNCVFLKNGFRSASFLNPDEWLSISDTVHAVRIDIVYSKYPLRNGVYKEIYPLLFNRLKATFSMDPSLNSSELIWNKILQTHCEYDQQVDSMFHGVVIWYEVDEPATTDLVTAQTKVDRINLAKANLLSDQMTFDEIKSNVEIMEQSPLLSDSIRKKLNDSAIDEKIEILQEYYKAIIDSTPKIPYHELDEETLLAYKNEIERFMNRYSDDPVVTEVLNRHPEWQEILVVNDWTGSMYQYGAQVLKWHILNHEKSGIQSITLFNDGDSKSQSQKLVGETGGVYFEEADNIEQLIALFNYVMTKGGGGDGPENDIEAILATLEEFPRFSEVVLIADNNACVRDIALADRIGVPVRIIICGYQKSHGVHPDYIYLAKKTGGGIYTIDQDIENLEASIEDGGIVNSMDTEGLKMTKKNCGKYYSGFDFDMSEIVKLEKSRFKKKSVRRIDASGRDLEKVPSWIERMRRLEELNLSSNKLKKIESSITTHRYLRILNVSKNNLKTLPSHFVNLKFLVDLDLSENEILEFPNEIKGLVHLKKLNLSHNNITKYRSIKAKGLLELNLSFNEISSVGTGLRRYTYLQSVNLSNNQLLLFPEFLPNAGNLKNMNLANNQIQKLPLDLSQLLQLEELDLRNNPISEAERNRITNYLVHTKVLF